MFIHGLFDCFNLILFAKAKGGKAYELMNILNLFSRALGWRINVFKSVLIFGNGLLTTQLGKFSIYKYGMTLGNI